MQERRKKCTCLFKWDHAGCEKHMQTLALGSRDELCLITTLLERDEHLLHQQWRERCALSWFRLAGFKILLYNSFFFFFCKLHVISSLIPWLPGCPVPEPHIKTGNPARSRSWNCFLVGPISCWAGSSSSEMNWKATLVSEWNVMNLRVLLTCGGRAGNSSWRCVFLIPCSWGWEFDPILSVRNDTYLLDYTAWKREKTVPSVRHYRNQTFLLLK